MKIVGCYIVKNEAQPLLRSLNSLQGQVDEVVVVDTGSTDNTIAVAQKQGAKVYAYKWQNDFSAARNYALAQLKGDWVVFLDADEYFTAATMNNLRGLIEGQPADVNLLLVKRHDVDEQGTVMLSLYVPRIFRIREDFRYEGAIHEEIRQRGELIEGIVSVPEEILALMHTGYAGDLGEVKARRNLGILLQEMNKSKEPEHFYGYLAETYDGLDEIDKAMYYAYMDIERGRQAETYASRSYRVLLKNLSKNPQCIAERLRVVSLAVRDFPELPEFHAELAEALAADWQYEPAVQEMAKACALGTAYHGFEPSLFDEDMLALCQQRQQLFAQKYASGKKIRISACVITKNEAANIGKWLANARSYANQIIVVDTGSEDNTCALAEGAEIFHIKWQDDFAAARNEALSHVREDWVAFLDADEYFAQPAKVRGLLAEIEAYHPEVEAVRVMISNIDPDDGGREISSFCNIRLFRNKPELRYQGRVHENIVHAIKQEPVCLEAPNLQVVHTGYASGKMEAKAIRNLALLQKDIAQKGEQPQHYRYLADCYYALGEYKQAEVYALQAITSPWQGKGTKGDMYYLAWLCMRALSEPRAEQLRFAAAAVQKMPQVPDFWAVLGLLNYEEEHYTEAVVHLGRACAMAARRDIRESSSFGDLAAWVYAAKADCEYLLGDRPSALKDSEKAMALNPYEDLALEVFCELRQEIPTESMAEKLAHYYGEKEETAIFLSRFFKRMGFLSLHTYYYQKIQSLNKPKEEKDDYSKIMAEGQWEALVLALQGDLIGKTIRLLELLIRLSEKNGKKYRQMEKQLIPYLPLELYDSWQVFRNGEEVRNWDSYKLMWKYIHDYGTEEQIRAYAEKSIENREIRDNIIKELMDREHWQTAFSLLSKISVDEADGEFWERVGTCLYHLDVLEEMRECFAKARQKGVDTVRMAAYEEWVEGRKKDG